MEVVMSKYLLVSFFSVYASIVHAQDVEEIHVFNIYSANTDTPVSYHDLSKDTLDKNNALQEPSFLLSKTPSITVYSDSGSYQGYSYFRLRGMDQTRVNMTLDDVPLNEPEDQGVYFSNFPGIFGSLDKVQIQRGVGISQNGTASYAGSIQLSSIELKSPERLQLDGGYGSNNTYSGAAGYLSGFENNKSFYFSASGVKSDGYKYDSGNESYSLFSSGLLTDEFGAWKYIAFSGRQSNELAWLGVNEDRINENRRANANKKENDHFHQSLFSVARDFLVNDYALVEARAYYSQLDGNYDFNLNNFLGIPDDVEIYNYAFASKLYGFITNVSYQDNGFSLAGGVHVNQYERDHLGSEMAVGRLYKNTGLKDSYAFFVKGAYELEGITLFSDVQYRYTDFGYQGDVKIEKIDWSFVNAIVGVSTQFQEFFTVYYSIGKTGREPTRTDLFGGNDNLEFDPEGRPQLHIVDPESVLNHELGVRYNNQEKLQGSLNLFYMDFDNEITLNGNFGPNGLLLTQDVDRSVRQGVELDAEMRLIHNVKMILGMSYSDAFIRNNGVEFHPILTPESIINIGSEYSAKNFHLGVEYRYQSNSYINLSNTERIDSFYVVNTYAAYYYRDWELRLAANNLFNKEYYTSGSMDANNSPAYFVAQPLNFFISSKVKF